MAWGDGVPAGAGRRCATEAHPSCLRLRRLATRAGAACCGLATRSASSALALATGLGLGCLIGLVPVGCLLLVARIALRYWESRELRRMPPPQQPPVIIVPTGYLPPQPPPWDTGTGTQLVQSAGPRSFTVIGEE